MRPLRIEPFSFSYDGHDRLTYPPLCFEPGLNILKGANGSGKTTYLKALAGLLGERVHQKESLYMSEKPSFPSYMRVKDYLMALESASPSTKGEANELLERFGLHAKREARIESLSKGMRQKLALIETLNEARPLYLLDEPFNGIDKAFMPLALEAVSALKGIVIVTLHEAVDFKGPLREVYL